jgi:hypothetical protein
MTYLVVIGDLIERAEQTSILGDRMGALPSTSCMYQQRAAPGREMDVLAYW